MSIGGEVGSDMGGGGGCDISSEDALLAISVFAAIFMLALVAFVLIAPQLMQTQGAFQTASLAAGQEGTGAGDNASEESRPVTRLRVVYSKE